MLIYSEQVHDSNGKKNINMVEKLRSGVLSLEIKIKNLASLNA